MKLNHITRGLFIIAVILQVSCVKDKGNYQYEEGNPVNITFAQHNLQAVIDEPLTINPSREFLVPGKTLNDYNHEWYVEGKIISTAPEIVYNGQKSGTITLSYYMVDKSTGIRFTGGFLEIHVVSPYETGWDILYEKDGESEIAHVRVSETGFKDQIGLYKEKNNGESLGSAPIRIKDYAVNKGRGLIIIQQGGQGTVELDGLNFEKKLVMSNSFTGGVPAGFKPVNASFCETSDMVLSEDGNLYPRLFLANPIAFTVPWLNIPVQSKKPMKITQLWDVWTMNTYYTFMYDEINNRLMYILLKGITTIDPNSGVGGMLQVDTIPAPPSYFPAPPGYINPSNSLTGYSYIWGSTFNDNVGFTTMPAFLVKEVSTGDVYLQTLSFTSIFGIQTIHMPGAKLAFTGKQYLNAASKFVAIKSRGFMFFSGDTDNQGLYYFDVRLGGASKLYDRLPAGVTVLRQSDDGQQLVVGLADGTVIFYDISNQTMLSGGPVELHRLSGLGRIADITMRGGYQM